MKELIPLVKEMREEQRNYFAAAAKARKTKASIDWATAANTLKKSKALEAKVDALLTSHLSPLTPNA